MIFSFIGIALIIGASYFRDVEVSYEGSQNIHWYALLMLAGSFLFSCQKVYEEHILKNHEISLRRFLGLQGLVGFLLSFLFQIIFFIVYAAIKHKKNSVSEFFGNLQGGETLVHIYKSNCIDKQISFLFCILLF